MLKLPENEPPAERTPSRLQGRLLFQYHRLALHWRALRDGRGRAVTLAQESGLVRVHDGVRGLYIPHPRLAVSYRDGVNAAIAAVAEKYVGGTSYAPREGDVIVDIGAGIGEFALWCGDAGARVIAFEPDPLAYACLERNTAPNSAITTVQQALWKENARLRLHGAVDTTQSSLIEDGTATRSVEIEAWPLDQVRSISQLQVIDFMKIDGEGVEPEILVGAVRTLRRTRILAVDIGAAERRPNLRGRVETILDSLGFRWLPQGPRDTREAILAVNTAMVGPFSSRVLGRRSS